MRSWHRIDSILAQPYLDFEVILVPQRQLKSEGRIQREKFSAPVQAEERE